MQESRLALFVTVAAFLGACEAGRDEKASPQVEGSIDIESLRRTSPARAYDIRQLIDARRSRLATCADPLRSAVGGLPEGSVIATIPVRAHAGRLTSGTVSLSGPRETITAVGDCLAAALTRQTIDVPPGAEYEFTVTVHLCIDRQRPSTAT